MESNPLPDARVRLESGFAARVARFALEQQAGRRTPREDFAGSSSRIRAGSGEFAGRRRYRAGDDLRAFDWEAFARGAGAFVRLSRGESAPRWSVLLDSSASMAVGAPHSPPKIQLAAELALALCAVGLAAGAVVTLATQRGLRVLRSRQDLPRAFAEIDGLGCVGGNPLPGWFEQRQVARASRCIVVSDLFDVDPARILSGATGRRIDAICVNAPIELEPASILASAAGAVNIEWRDPESAALVVSTLTEREIAQYATALGRHHRHWRAGLARSGGRLVIARAGTAFEPHALRLLQEHRS